MLLTAIRNIMRPLESEIRLFNGLSFIQTIRVKESAMLEQRNNILSTLLNRSIYCFGRDNYALIFDMLTSECDIGFFQQKIIKPPALT